MKFAFVITSAIQAASLGTLRTRFLAAQGARSILGESGPPIYVVDADERPQFEDFIAANFIQEVSIPEEEQ